MALWTVKTYPPGTIRAHGTSSSATSFKLSPSTAATTVVERVDDLLNPNYKGSSVGANDK
jgi:hypothetical protein